MRGRRIPPFQFSFASGVCLVFVVHFCLLVCGILFVCGFRCCLVLVFFMKATHILANEEKSENITIFSNKLEVLD